MSDKGKRMKFFSMLVAIDDLGDRTASYEKLSIMDEKMVDIPIEEVRDVDVARVIDDMAAMIRHLKKNYGCEYTPSLYIEEKGGAE